MKREARGTLWAIILAAGEGTRLASLTSAMHGRPVPKQFASLLGDRTFLQRTMDRIAPLVPPHRTVVVVSAQYLELARQQLAEFPGTEVVSQPANRGTGAGVLLPLAHVMARDPDARVVVFPSDHHVSRERGFREAVSRAVASASESPAGVCLVGAAAEGPATDLGWIACGGAVGQASCGARAVNRFVEKPAESVAVELLRQGGLWNTLVIAARGRALWNLAEAKVAATARALAPYRQLLGTREGGRLLEEIYAGLSSTDLSRDMLERAEGLTVVAMVDAGWSDCGTPERLLRAAHGPEQLPAVLTRLQSYATA
jgi:mannose-1-phosphate guanylyltransferase